MKRMFGLAAILVLAACGTSTAVDESAGAPTDSIGVTGNWTIDVIDPDGTVVDTYEFQNEILYSGWLSLARLLSGEEALRDWSIQVAGDVLTCDQCTFDAVADYEVFPTANPEVVLTGSGSPVLSSFGEPGPIEAVWSLVGFEGGPSIGEEFSYHSLSEPILLAEGQSIQVEIRFALG